MRTAGLLVVERVNFFTDARYRSLDRVPALDLTHIQVLDRYKGFDGLPWPKVTGAESLILHDGLAALDQYQAVLAYFKNAQKSLRCDLLWVHLPNLSSGTSPHPEFHFVGFDFGFYLSDTNHFSVILHEVIYGKHDQLKEFAGFLNDHLLLPTMQACERLKQERTELVTGGADLETEGDDEGFVPIAVYACGA